MLLEFPVVLFEFLVVSFESPVLPVKSTGARGAVNGTGLRTVGGRHVWGVQA